MYVYIYIYTVLTYHKKEDIMNHHFVKQHEHNGTMVLTKKNMIFLQRPLAPVAK